MATWLAHLRIAENLLSAIPSLDAGQFAIGNLGPDAGIPDEKWETFNPPAEVTHFKRSKSVHKDIADLDFYRGYLANIPPEDTPRFSFRLGYFFHLIIDNLWTVQIGLPTAERFADRFAADKSFIWEVKKDWYGLDHIYVREHPDCLYWRVFLDAQLFDTAPPDGDKQGRPASADLDFFPPQAFSRQMDHIKSFYQRDDEEIRAMMARPMIYLSREGMDRFIENATNQILHIYSMLWPTPPDLAGKFSALELFS